MLHENRVGERVYAMGIVGAVEKLEGACGRTCGANLWGKPGLGQKKEEKEKKRKEKKRKEKLTSLLVQTRWAATQRQLLVKVVSPIRSRVVSHSSRTKPALQVFLQMPRKVPFYLRLLWAKSTVSSEQLTVGAVD